MGKRDNIALAFNNLFLQAAHCLFENGDSLDNSSDSTLAATTELKFVCLDPAPALGNKSKSQRQ